MSNSHVQHQTSNSHVQHQTIYREPGRFVGWPANYGIWMWGDEIVVGFTLGHVNPAGGFHARDTSRPFRPMQARSLDGGSSWEISPTNCPIPGQRQVLSADEHVDPALKVATLEITPEDIPPCPGVDFRDPELALMCGRSGLNAGAVSWFYTSTDRCRSWQGPYRLPGFGYTGLAARTDYLLVDRDTCLFFLTAAKSNGHEGRVFVARTSDGGRSFARFSQVGPEPDGFAIMPAHAALPSGRILLAVRGKEGGDFAAVRSFIDLYTSDDGGASWAYAGRPAPDTGSGGNPPTLTRLHDGRICLIYGYRDAPFGIHARLSEDDGASWSQPIVLREDGGNHDIGYPRTVQQADGTILTVYYFNDAPDGERYLAATRWRP